MAARPTSAKHDDRYDFARRDSAAAAGRVLSARDAGGCGRRVHGEASVTSRPSRKRPVPLDEVRRYLEPGPVVLVSSAHDGERDVMVMGWHRSITDN